MQILIKQYIFKVHILLKLNMVSVIFKSSLLRSSAELISQCVCMHAYVSVCMCVCMNVCI